MYSENSEGTRVIVGSMNMWYVSDTDRTQTRNQFRPKCASIPLGHSAPYKHSSLGICFFSFEIFQNKLQEHGLITIMQETHISH